MDLLKRVQKDKVNGLSLSWKVEVRSMFKKKDIQDFCIDDFFG